MVEGLVSVVIPTYKRSEMLPRAIQSVLDQTYNSIEVLIVDDNIPGDEFSQDVKKLVASYANERVRYVGQDEHINGAKARNEGIKASRGEFITFLDDDDEWLPEKTEKQVEFLRLNPECGGVTCLWEIRKNGEFVRGCQPYGSENLQYKVFSREVQVMTITVFVRRKVIDDMRGWDSNLKRHQDLQFLIDVLAVSKLGVVNEVLSIVHADSEMNRPDTKRLITVKDAFFESVKDELIKYSKKEQKNIFAAHYFEVVVSALKERKICIALKYLLKIGLNLRGYVDVVKRYRSR